MSYFVYILFSQELNRYYVGSTVLSIEERLERHLTDFYGNSKFTHKAKDWQIVHSIECQSLNQSRRIERHIKAMKSRVYIENLISIPDFSDKLLVRFKGGQD